MDLEKTSPNMKKFVRIGRWWYVPREKFPTRSISLGFWIPLWYLQESSFISIEI
jgi:hypothetical protein